MALLAPLTTAATVRFHASGLQAAYGTVAGIGHVHRSRGGDGHAGGPVEGGGGGRSPVAGIAARAGAGDGGNGAVGVDLAHAPAEIGHVEAACGVHGQAERVPQLRVDGRAAIAGVTRQAIAREGGDQAAGRHLADDVVAGVGDVEIAGGIHRHSLGRRDLGVGGRPAISRITRRAVTGDGEDLAAVATLRMRLLLKSAM